jgi:hypothetical protein
MSKMKCVTTPLPIMVGKKRYNFITFEDLFSACLKDKGLFPEMLDKPRDIGIILEKRKLVMAVQCIESLRWLLAQKELVAIAEALLKSRTPWPVLTMAFSTIPKLKGYTAPCTWPNCPPD